MATPRQIEANQKNAVLSKGPRTEAGKEQSRRNALRHGMAGAGVVLPDEETALVARRVESWGRSLRPQNEHEDWLVEQAALESVRIDRCVVRERVVLCERSSRAEFSWEIDRRLDAEKLANRLARQPGVVRLQLLATPQGCDLLIERWEALRAALAPGKPWDEANREIALDLLGVLPEFREVRTEVDAKEGDDAVALQSAVALDEIEQLKIRKAEWLDDFDAQSREWAICGYSAPDVELNRVRRYESACRRRLDAALRQLALAHKGVTLPETLRPPSMSSSSAAPAPAPVVPAFEFALLDEVPAGSPLVNPLDEQAEAPIDLDAAIAELTEAAGLVVAPVSAPAESPVPAPAPAPKVSSVPTARPVHTNRRQRRAAALKARQAAR